MTHCRLARSDFDSNLCINLLMVPHSGNIFNLSESIYYRTDHVADLEYLGIAPDSVFRKPIVHHASLEMRIYRKRRRFLVTVSSGV